MLVAVRLPQTEIPTPKRKIGIFGTVNSVFEYLFIPDLEIDIVDIVFFILLFALGAIGCLGSLSTVIEFIVGFNSY